MKPTFSVAAVRQPAKSAVTIEALAAGYCLLSILLPLVSPLFKALSYANPFVGLIAILASRRISLPPNGAPYLVLVGSAALMAPFASIKGAQDTWLILMGLSPFCFGYRYKLSWDQIFGATVAATVATFLLIVVPGGRFTFDVFKSQSSFEASTSFIFGVLAVWAAMRRQGLRAVLALLFAIITLKRIVVLAALVAIVALLLPRRFVDRLLRPLPMLLINVAAIALAIGYANGSFDQIIQDVFQQSSNQFGMGRQALYMRAVYLLSKNPWEFVLYGLGPGGVYPLLSLRGNATALLLHNDSLKILVEYGGVVWILFFWLLYSGKRLEVRVMMLFMNVLLLTDNTLIYPFVIAAISLALLSLTQGQEGAPSDGNKQARPRARPPARWPKAPVGTSPVP